jgi:hypothetical protein
LLFFFFGAVFSLFCLPAFQRTGVNNFSGGLGLACSDPLVFWSTPGRDGYLVAEGSGWSNQGMIVLAKDLQVWCRINGKLMILRTQNEMMFKSELRRLLDSDCYFLQNRTIVDAEVININEIVEIVKRLRGGSSTSDNTATPARQLYR